MNYTPNYHLPQWVEDDPILRTDFNQMCAAIDEAIAGTAQSETQSASQAWDGLLRLAQRDLEKQWPQLDPSGIYNAGGIFYNPLTSSAMAETLTSLSWSSQKGVYAGCGQSLGQTLLRNSCSDCWPGNSNAAPGTEDACSLYRFTAPQTAYMRGCTFFFYTQFTSTLQNLSLTLTFTAEKKSGSTFTEIFTKHFLIERSGTAAKRLEIPVDLGFPIVKNTEYRLKLAIRANMPQKSPVPGRFGFIVDRISEDNPMQGYNDHSLFDLETLPVNSGSHTKTFQTGGAASHGLVMLHYRKKSQDSALLPTLDGQAMTHLDTVQRTGTDGDSYWESWYACAGSFSGSTALQIQFTAGSSDELCLLRYAVSVL